MLTTDPNNQESGDDEVWVDLEQLDEPDLQILAEKVYALLRREVMLDRERMGQGRPGSGWSR